MKSKIYVVLIIISLLLMGCNGNALVQPSSTMGQIEGVVVQGTSDININGTIQLMKEEYLTATPDSTTTLESGESGLETSIDKDGKFTLNDIQPGRYYLDVSVELTPCFLGAPGQVFNGANVTFMENWSPLGFSFTDGSSLITGKTNVYDITAGDSLDVTLQLPKCY